MSSVWGISKNLLWNKMKAITLILFIDLMINLAIVQFMGRQYSGYLLEKAIFSALSTLMIAVIYLVKINEENLVHNKYRLVPITDLNLYLSNLVTSCLAFFYVVILDFAIYSGTRYVLNIPISDLNSAELLESRLLKRKCDLCSNDYFFSEFKHLSFKKLDGNQSIINVHD